MKRKTARKSKRRMRNKKTQKIWIQKGCYNRKKHLGHSPRCNCRLCVSSPQTGGCGCGATALFQSGGCGCGLQFGGSSGGVPPPLIGSPWMGVGGIDGQTNYLALNKYPVDPQTQVVSERDGTVFPPHSKFMNGGRKRKGKVGRMTTIRRTRIRKSKKGGSGTLFPQDLVNLGRTFTYGIGSAYNSIGGYPQPVSPLPYQNQLRNYSISKI